MLTVSIEASVILKPKLKLFPHEDLEKLPMSKLFTSNDTSLK